jgi:glycosyltransferase involved in cell wall biosynthesis
MLHAAISLAFPTPVTSPPLRALRSPDDRAELDLTLFVACYNEEANILDTLATVAEALREVGCTYEIVVIDDASTDRSVEFIRAYQEQHPELPLFLRVNPVNRGLARNFVEASFLARGAYYKLVCGDNVESKETLVRILRQMGEADLVLPYHEHCPGKSWSRLLLSRTFTRLVNLLSGHRIRYYNGLALYRRFHVMRWHSNASGFGFQADLVTRLLDEGASWVEVCCEVCERSQGRSRALSLLNFLSVGHTLLEIAGRRLRRFLCRA